MYGSGAFSWAQRFALAAPPNGHYGSATAYKRKYVRNTAVGGVGYRRCWAGAWQTTGLRDARPWARQRHGCRRIGQRCDDTRYRDRPYGTRSGDRPSTGPTAHDPATGHPARTGPYGTPCPATDTTARDDHPRRHARRRALRHATTILVAGPGDGRYGTRRSSRTR